MAAAALKLGRGLRDKWSFLQLLACHGGLRPFPGGRMICRTTVPGTASLHLRMTGTDAILFVEVIVDAEYRCLHALSFTPKNIFDVGANIGLGSFYLKSLFPGAVINGFEPAGAEREILLANYSDWQQCTAHATALGDRDEAEVRFAVHPDRTGGQHLMREGDEGWIEEKVPLARADTLIRNGALTLPDLVKVDVEGAEVAVLEGFGDYLGQVRAFVIETHSPSLHDECVTRLTKAGHRIVSDEMPRSQEARILMTEK